MDKANHIENSKLNIALDLVAYVEHILFRLFENIHNIVVQFMRSEKETQNKTTSRPVRSEQMNNSHVQF